MKKRKFVLPAILILLSIAFFNQSHAYEKIAANPAAGFYWPYFLYVPEEVTNIYMLVVSNNSGWPSNDFAYHEEKARFWLQLYRSWADDLKSPFLIPIFPRPGKLMDDFDWKVTPQQIERNSLTTKNPRFFRPDLQLIAMIDDARIRLEKLGIPIDKKILFTGSSTSATFGTRFAALNPNRVKAIAMGANQPIIPASNWKGLRLPYPYGVADLKKLTGKNFDLRSFAKIPQYSYWGELDYPPLRVHGL